MTKRALQYLHVYIFTYRDSKPITLFEQILSYYPIYKIDDEISFLITQGLDVSKDHEIKNYKVKEVRSIFSIDKKDEVPPQHTMYVRVEHTINDNEDKSEENTFTIDFFLKSMSSN
jgi:uncharacterized protein (UPF0335 family)